MYKLLLSWRYLRTRYIALASVISVTLGVATMIVVNSVMAGFSHEMRNRIHGILSDVIFEAHSLEGFPDVERHMDEIRRVAGDDVVAMTPTVAVPAMLSGEVNGQWVTRQINLIGIDKETYAEVSDFGKFLVHPKNRERLDFVLRDGGYETPQAGDDLGAPRRPQLAHAGWEHRRAWARFDKARRAAASQPNEDAGKDPFAAAASKKQQDENLFDPMREQHTGIVLGIALAAYRTADGEDRFLFLPGDDIRITFPTAGTPPKAESDIFTIVDFYESKMSEYDSSFVFMPLDRMQELRGMLEPATGTRSATSIQIKLREGADLDKVRDKLRAHFPPELYGVNTWRDKQGPLLAAVNMETAILNVLLFLIIAVAGFGILAIFFMIVVEKTRDIGILKSLGASERGVMGIFLGYGISLGMVGSGVGMVMGLMFVIYINEIADWLGRLTGRPVFDPSIYYFQKIPTIIDPFTVGWIMCGAVLIAVTSSILPARHAAKLHPVEALRYE